jgi:signal transduction histidine kinase
MPRRRISITTKLAAALAVPLAALSLVAGLEVGQSVRDAREVARQTDLATASIGPSGLITALQNERNFTGLWLLGSEKAVQLPVSSMEQARSETDAARQAFTDELARKGGTAAKIYGPAMDKLSRLTKMRAAVDAYDGPKAVSLFNETANNSFTDYTELVQLLSDRNSVLTTEIQDEQLRRGVELIDRSGREIDLVARLVRLSLLTATTGDGRLTGPDEIARAADAVDASLRSHDKVLELATGPYKAAGENLKQETDATGLLQMGPKLIRTGRVDVQGMLRGISLRKDESYYGFLRDVSKIVQDRADHLNQAAQNRSRWYLGAAALVMLAAVAAIVAVSRSIVRPLKDLTRQSITMAERRLPAAVRSVLETPVGEDVVVPEIEPVTVNSSDEVAAVAETLNKVQSAAVRLAVDQALLRRNVADAFVNLARRNQNLLSRQLDFITDLERDETRTQTLDNLFRLDHLATRMRRNAESLLVLAGAETPRTWSGPVRLHDVVRAALGEVEDYQRVVLHDLEGATVLGSVASDLAHLLAELVENALRFSPPEKDVEISGRSRVGGYVLLVADDGLGMTEQDIAMANERLSRNEMFSIASPRYLGHYVAGNLAARHGIGVRLYRSACQGVTVAVELPVELLAPGLELDPHVAGALGGPAPALGAPGAGHRPEHPQPPIAAAPFVPLPDDAGYGAPVPSPTGFMPDVSNGHRGNIYAGPAGNDHAAHAPAGNGHGNGHTASAHAATAGNGHGNGHGPARSIVDTGLPPRPPTAPMAPGLARRIPGAQMPQTSLHGLRRTPDPAPGGAPVPPPAPGDDDVFRVITEYVAGLDRGRSPAGQ